MPRVGFVTGGGSVTPEMSPSLLAFIRARASRAMLEKTYHSTSGFCRVCGVHLETEWGEPLGRYFVMDKNGCFYCMNCDRRFGEGDEEIYVPEEDI